MVSRAASPSSRSRDSTVPSSSMMPVNIYFPPRGTRVSRTSSPSRLTRRGYVVLVANRQLRVVVQHGLGTDGDRIARGPLPMYVGARDRAGDPPTGPVRRRGPPVERGRELPGDERPPRPDAVQPHV